MDTHCAPGSGHDKLDSAAGEAARRYGASSGEFDRTYTLPEAAELSGTSIGTLWTLIRERKLAANVKPGSYGLEYRVRAEALAALQTPGLVEMSARDSAEESARRTPTEKTESGSLRADLQAGLTAGANTEARAAEAERLIAALQAHIADLQRQLQAANENQAALFGHLSTLQAELFRQR